MNEQQPAKILEIFKSIQGEGKFAGVRQVFVRFYECNMHCVWCDTPNSIGHIPSKYKEYTLTQLTEELERIGLADCHSVSLTGGEPLLQAEFIRTLLPILRQKGVLIYLDTNGTLPKALATVIEGIDIVAMDIKMPSSTQCQPFWAEHVEFLKIAATKDVFVKVVVSNNTAFSDMVQAVNVVKDVNPSTLFILQPNFFELREGVVNKCLEYFDYCQQQLPNVRLLPQMHKMLKVR